jgi:hypothetical protein
LPQTIPPLFFNIFLIVRLQTQYQPVSLNLSGRFSKQQSHPHRFERSMIDSHPTVTRRRPLSFSQLFAEVKSLAQRMSAADEALAEARKREAAALELARFSSEETQVPLRRWV